jgi:hypothetical protein
VLVDGWRYRWAMLSKKTRFRDRTPLQKAVIVLVTLASLAIVGFAERDLQGRPEGQIRGSRFAWRLASLNAVGAIAYLRFGRR